MRKKYCISFLAFFLAIVMTVISPAQVIADSSKKQYIKEIRIGYGEDGKQQLVDAGYTVWEKLNANEGGNGNAVYLGYITTDRKEEAVTDVAVMPMGSENDRAYSFEAYTKEMEHLSSQIDRKLENFDAAIEEFRENLQKPEPYNVYAKRAYTMLNQFIEDDTNLGVGELFANGSFNEDGTFEPFDHEPNTEAYHNVLMMGNSTVVSAIQTALSMGCTETEGETFLDRLEAAEYVEEIDPSDNHDLTTLSVPIESFRDVVLSANSSYEKAVATSGSWSAYYSLLQKNAEILREKADSLKDATVEEQEEAELAAIDASEEAESFVQQATLINILKDITYGDIVDPQTKKSITFLDAILLPTTYSPKSPLFFDSFMLYLLVQTMTPGQIAIAEYVGFSMLIQNAYCNRISESKDIEGNKHYALELTDDYLSQFDQVESVSVYLGVDRSVFSDYKTVAITSAAIRSQTVNNGLGVKAASSATNSKALGLIVSGSVIAAAGLATFIYAASKFGGTYVEQYKAFKVTENICHWNLDIIDSNNVLYQNVKIDGTWNDVTAQIAEKGGKIDLKRSCEVFDKKITEKPGAGFYETSTSTKVFASVGAIAMAVGIALAIWGFVEKNKTPEPAKVDYSPIPRAVIEVKTQDNGDSFYFPYYAAKLANTQDDAYLTEEDTSKLYGDLNGLNTIEPWLCLYYARDLRLGSPLTPTMLVKETDDRTSAQKTLYAPIHDFFNNDLVANNAGYAPFNLNHTSLKSDAPSIYVFLKRDLTVSPLAATLMENSALLIAVGSFIAGAGLACMATLILTKRKHKKLISSEV